MKPIFKLGIGSVIALAVLDKSGIVPRLAKSGDAKVHGTEWAEAKYREQAGHRSHCDRCGESTRGGSTMSMRSEQMICMDCKDSERAEPNYKEFEAQDLREYAGRLRQQGMDHQARNVEEQARRLLEAPPKKGRGAEVPPDLNPKDARRLRRWLDILTRRGLPHPPSRQMDNLVNWVRAVRPDLTPYTADQAMKEMQEWDAAPYGINRNKIGAHHYRRTGGVQDGIVRLNNKLDLARLVSNELQIDFANGAYGIRGGPFWQHYNEQFALFVFFRGGKPRWVVAGLPAEAQTPAEVTSIQEAKRGQNRPVTDPEFLRLFGGAVGRQIRD
ncbi:MAG TPA: hypothetical protein EYF98_10670 [Planctomycetes bacterium]|nr:hypothetical protein [Planctomycetota bacterium]